jgi:phage shock protein A
MSLIDNRLRLHRRHCEEQRRHFAELEHLARRLRADATRLQAEIARAVALGNQASARPLIERHAKVERSIDAVEAQIAAAALALAAAEQELKWHELTAAQRDSMTEVSREGSRRRIRRGRPATAPLVGPDRGS